MNIFHKCPPIVLTCPRFYQIAILFKHAHTDCHGFSNAFPVFIRVVRLLRVLKYTKSYIPKNKLRAATFKEDLYDLRGDEFVPT